MDIEEKKALLQERMALLERQLQEMDATSGIPPVVGGFARRIITNSTPLYVFQELVEIVASAEYEADQGGGISKGEDKDKLPFIPRARWTNSRRWKGSWWIIEIQEDRKTGRITKDVYPLQPSWRRRLDILLNSGGERCAYNFTEAELKAQARLFSILSEVQQAAYILNGAFFEIARSGLWYLLRKGRPTIAIRMHEDEWSWWMDVLCALCLHPLGFYEHTWAGVMTPSDEVLAHLLHIRADEHYFWRKANQIPLDAVESGI